VRPNWRRIFLKAYRKQLDSSQPRQGRQTANPGRRSLGKGKAMSQATKERQNRPSVPNPTNMRPETELKWLLTHYALRLKILCTKYC